MQRRLGMPVLGSRRRRVNAQRAAVKRQTSAGQILDGNQGLCRLRAVLPLLITKQDEIGPAPYAKLGQQIRDVKLHGSFRNVEFSGDFLIRKILEQLLEHFLLAAAQLRPRSEE